MTEPTTQTPREEARSWSPTRAHDDDRGPRCGAERDHRFCELARGHHGAHQARVSDGGATFSWSGQP